MILPDNTEVLLDDEAEINSYGIYIELRNMTSTLNVFSDDETLYDS